MADELPGAGEDAPLLELRDLRISVVPRLELAPALLRSKVALCRFRTGVEGAQGVILTL
jgi:hypothetical protein